MAGCGGSPIKVIRSTRNSTVQPKQVFGKQKARSQAWLFLCAFQGAPGARRRLQGEGFAIVGVGVLRIATGSMDASGADQGAALDFAEEVVSAVS